jgi:hypothetical protein
MLHANTYARCMQILKYVTRKHLSMFIQIPKYVTFKSAELWDFSILAQFWVWIIYILRSQAKETC